MQELVVREGLDAMAREASERFHELVAEGAEIPYEVHASGEGSPLCRYEPLTERFVRDNASKLRELDSFGAGCAALEAAGLAGHYLEQMGIAVPVDPRERAELAGIAFLCRLWMDSLDFSLEHERLDAAIAEVERGGEVTVGEIEVIVPIRGLQMPISRLELEGVTLIRADTVDVPSEAQAGDLHGASPWEPAFLAVTNVPDPELDEGERDSTSEAVEAFRRLITTLRLYKSGGVGLGPHAWTRISGDRWRRIATGAGRARPGAYRLCEAELGPLAALSRALSGRTTPFGRLAARRPGSQAALGRAISRFEAGLERNVVIEALNDHLLSLRFVLEGGGPADLGLSMRVAALCAEPDRRAEVKSVVDRAIGLERELWSGEPAPSAKALTPAETALELEGLARAILKDAACGHLGSDLRGTADEILLADGLAVGDGTSAQRGETAEWSAGSELAEEIVAEATARPRPIEISPCEPELIEELDRLGEAIEASPLDQPINPEPDQPQEADQMRLATDASTHLVTEPRPANGHSAVLELIERTRAERKARQVRVADLFPAPEPTDWNVREIAYDRRRRATIETA